MRLGISFICGLIFYFGIYKMNAQSTGDTSQYEFFVQLQEGIELDTLEEYLEDMNSTEVWSHEYSNLSLWRINSFPFTMANGTQVFNISDVIRNSVRKTKITESDYNILSVLGDNTTTPIASCFDPLQFSITQGNQANIKISILDTGVDTIEQSTTSSLNYNLTTYTGYDYVNKDNIPDDEHGHGSHIAGIIHSITHALSPAGTNIQFDIRKTHNAQGQGMMSDIVKALLDAVDANANIINLSFGRTDTFNIDSFYVLRTAIQHALDKKVLVVVAAGNDHKNIDIFSNSTTPAVFPEGNIISVAALDCADTLSAFSNFGVEGVDISVIGNKIPGPDLDGGIRYASGTSQATAIVSAVAALVATHFNNFDPSILKCAILNGYSPISALSGKLLMEGKVNTSNANNLYVNQQSTYTINNANNGGIGSLRYGIENVCGVKHILFDVAINGQVINIENEPLFIDRNIHFSGNGQNFSIINGLNTYAIKVGYNGEILLKNLGLKNSGSASSTIVNKGHIIVENNAKIE